jgi:glycosyltransferase involved in cell wall biosynthesis
VVVLAFNEERNIGRLLQSVSGYVAAIYVVDSGSADTTESLGRQYGAQFLYHSFESHSRQWNWALKNLPITTEWVLGLDADQYLTVELRDGIRSFIASADNSVAGGLICRRQIFRGKWIRHGGYYPKYLLKLFRLNAVHVDEGELVDHHFRVEGRAAKVEGDLIEDNRNEYDISAWIAKHNRYATLQAQEEFQRRKRPYAENQRAAGAGDPMAFWKRIWRSLPPFVRPVLYFVYRYFIRLGFLDGKQGFVFHFMQALWYRLLVDINLDDLKNS